MINAGVRKCGNRENLECGNRGNAEMFNFLKKKQNRVVDGKIINETVDTPIQQTQIVDTRDNHGNIIEIELPDKPADIHYPIIQYTHQPSYLLDRYDGGDLGLFISWMITENYKKSSQVEITRDLQQWKMIFEGSFCMDKIRDTLGKFKPNTANRLLFSLKTYAKYRNFYNDPRLLILLMTVNNPLVRKKPQKKDYGINNVHVTLLLSYAKEQCQKGNRIGVLLGLCMYGIHSNMMKSIDVEKIMIPDWLHEATGKIKDWRVSRVTVFTEIKRINYNPRMLFNIVNTCNTGESGKRKP